MAIHATRDHWRRAGAREADSQSGGVPGSAAPPALVPLSGLATTTADAWPVPSGHETAATDRAESLRRSFVQRASSENRADTLGGLVFGDPAVSIVRRAGSAGRPLDGAVAADLGTRLGADFTRARIHTDSNADAVTQSVDAAAMTVGTDIFFKRGAYAPNTRAGRELLAHELTHVRQNQGGQSATMTSLRALSIGRADDPAEREAEATARAVMNGAAPPEAQASDTPSTTVVRRKLIYAPKGTKPGKGEVVDSLPSAKLTVLERIMAEYYLTSSSKHSITYESNADLKKKMADAASNPPDSFFLSLKSLDDLDLFVQKLQDAKITPASSMANALEARRQRLQKKWNASLGPAPTLPKPLRDPLYTPPKDSHKTAASRKGRDDAGFKKVPNPVEGTAGKTTASVNVALIERERKSGSRFQVGETHLSVCATCGFPSDTCMFEVDHQQPWSDIRKQLHRLADGMRMDSALYKQIQTTTPGFDRFFLVQGVPGTPGCKVLLTEECANVFSNNLNNLMRICRKCNGPWGKSDMATWVWFGKTSLFGKPFIDYCFPSGIPDVPTTQVISTTENGQGLGKAARSWFETRHLPVLRDQQVMERLRAIFHDSLMQQTTLRAQSEVESDPVKKKKMMSEAKYAERKNMAIKGTVGATATYFGNEDLLGVPKPKEKKMSRMREDSPERVVKKIEGVFADREERKQNERLKRRDSYGDGRNRAYSGGNPEAPTKKRKKDADAYNVGFAEGQQAHAAELRLGEQAAIDCDGGASQAAREKIKAGRSPGFIQGFNNFWRLRERAYFRGRDDGQNRRRLNHGQVPQPPHGRDRLLMDYMDGYNDGRG